jgi:hypothetical protein
LFYTQERVGKDGGIQYFEISFDGKNAESDGAVLPP